MPRVFYNLGCFLGPKLRKGKWVWSSLTASQDEIIRAEFDVGRDMAAALARQMPLDKDLEAARLLVDLGERLAGRLTDRRRRWAFHLVAADVANAWALPGGFIFVTRPLVELCERKTDEIAFVLGHEIGHVVRGHAFDRLVTSTLLGAASRAAPLGRLITPKVLDVGVRLMQSAYTQDQELEADAFGVRLVCSAGLEPAASVRMMQRLQAQHGNDPLPDLFVYFSTHPPFATRLAQMRSLLNRAQ
ncbi:MAG: M48 family metalloprotease [Planctomycetes bacterium]|nr:M48 family metalloprotease [Planctomycetota bacterium]